MTAAVGTALLDRVATAPISWGVCEVPGWGYQLPVDRVLAEMAAAGFTHTELGSLGYLPTEAERLSTTLDSHGLRLLGGFVPLALHDPGRAAETRAAANRWADLIGRAGGQFFVTCAVSHPDHWRQGPLTDPEWASLCHFLGEIDALAGAHGLVQVFHSHFGSLVETDAELVRVLESSDVLLVLDTAHITIGGTDVVKLLDRYAHRVGLVHLKDLDPALGARLTAGELSLMEAVQHGFVPAPGSRRWWRSPRSSLVSKKSGPRPLVRPGAGCSHRGGRPLRGGLAQAQRRSEPGLPCEVWCPPARDSGAIHNNHRFPEGMNNNVKTIEAARRGARHNARSRIVRRRRR